MNYQPTNTAPTRPANRKGVGALVIVIVVIALLLLLFSLCTVQVPTGNTAIITTFGKVEITPWKPASTSRCPTSRLS